MAMRDKKDEESASYNPFVGLEKSSVLQEARTFNEMPIKVRKCSQILTKILFIIYQGDSIGTREATETFFAMTKLFQCKDMALRRMVYLCIKAMSTISEDVIMVTASLMKDINGPDDQCKGSAIRALCTITDSSMLQSIERYLKQGLVDRNAAMQSASLVSALHLLQDNTDVVKRWVNEVTQALNSRSQMAQYHALGLLYQIKSRDRLAVQKLVADQIKSSSLKSPFAYCLLIRFASKVMEQDPDNNTGMFEFLESCLRNKSEMVIYEAARAIVNIKNVTARDLAPAVSVLQLFLSSPRATLRFAAVRTLNKVAMTHPAALKTCNLDMEQLISDSNRSVATLAITTLLKTGTEASVDRLMKSISTFMHEISDEFKVVVIEAIRSLCIKFPKKHNVLMGFLAGVLRDEGGLSYKSAIVDTIINIVENVPDAKEAGLGHLCEFIEDCEFPNLLARTLHLIGDHGPRTPVPSKFIRFIYNRLILEDSVVRAAAVSALAKFGAECPPLRPSVLVLLRRALHDGDDEVRDRVTLYISLLESNNTALLVNPRAVSVTSLERSLGDYLAHGTDKPFDMRTVPVETAPVRRVDPEVAEYVEAAATGAASEAKAAAAIKTNQDLYAAQLASVPELEGLGPLFRSSKPTMLTESETEYVVQCVKHIFQEHVVFQFTCTNTLSDQVLEKVKVVLEGGEQEIDPSDVITVAIPVLKCDAPADAYVCIPLDCSIAAQTFSAKLDFVVKDCDPETGECDEEGYPDTYLLEDLDIALADYMQPVDKPNFGAAWETLEGAFEQEQTFALSSMTSLDEAINKIMEYLGMGACEKSNKTKEGKNTHTLYLAGVYVGGHEVLARAKLAFDQGVNMELAVRCTNETICELVANAIG